MTIRRTEQRALRDDAATFESGPPVVPRVNWLAPRGVAFLLIAGIIAAALVTIALSPSAAEPARGASSTQGAGADDACLVAYIGGEPVTMADVRSVRSLLQPPPPWPEATRLVVDVWLSSAETAARATEPPSAGARLAAYRNLHADARMLNSAPEMAAQIVHERLAKLAEQHRVERGPCYVARLHSSVASAGSLGSLRTR